MTRHSFDCPTSHGGEHEPALCAAEDGAGDFGRMMDDAFARLRVQEACSPHDWSKPTRALNRHGRMSTELFQTRCRKCGLYASRATLKRLKAEVIDLPGA